VPKAPSGYSYSFEATDANEGVITASELLDSVTMNQYAPPNSASG
jgi:hypothetical protein